MAIASHLPTLNQMSNQALKWPDAFSDKIAKGLKHLGYDLNQSQRLADPIKRLSNYYNGQSHHLDIWQNSDFAAAYLCYFFPLNLMRNLWVFKDLDHLGFLHDVNNIVDFGSGCGTVDFALSHFKSASFNCIEKNQLAKNLHQILSDSTERPNLQWIPDLSQAAGDTLTMSYSLNELNGLPTIPDSIQNLIIIEPSHLSASRQLMQLRQKLIQQGWFIWAPCTHQQSCPLLQHSNKDWCHFRIHIEWPDWYKKIESFLPMKNRTLTFSYLAAQRTRPRPQQKSEHTLARVIGDTQIQRGKTIQAVCFDEERVFLSWLKKEGTPPYIPRGQVVKLSQYEQKGNELRHAHIDKFLPNSD